MNSNAPNFQPKKLRRLQMTEIKRQRQLTEGSSRAKATYVDTLFSLELDAGGRQRLTDKELVSLCSEFLNGGTDTTAAALEWAMAHLATDQTIQANLYRKIMDVIDAINKAFIEIIFQNTENAIQTWHVDGYAFFVVGMDSGIWDSTKQSTYNLNDAVARSTTQVYPYSWTTVLMELDNVGMWNLRCEDGLRRYLGQELYMRVRDLGDLAQSQDPMSANELLCGSVDLDQSLFLLILAEFLLGFPSESWSFPSESWSFTVSVDDANFCPRSRSAVSSTATGNIYERCQRLLYSH